MLIAITQVRDVVQILPLCIANLLRQGADVVLVADHGSTDGTAEWLAAAARGEPRIQWTHNAEPGFHQADALTALARVAAAGGATWVLPVDADEFWLAADETATLRDVLDAHPAAAAVRVSTENFPPPTDLEVFGPDDLRRFRHRFVPAPDATVSPAEGAAMSAGKHSYLPHASRAKWVFRATGELEIAAGAHSATGLAPGPTPATEEIRLLHVPLRDREHLAAKRRHGELLRVSGYPEDHGWHTRMLLTLSSDEEWERLWRANSVSADGRLPSSLPCDVLVQDDVLVRLADRLCQPGAPPTSVPRPLFRDHGLQVTQALAGTARRRAGNAAALTHQLAVQLDREREAVRRRVQAEARSVERQAEVDRLERELSRRLGELDAMTASRSWRLTAPLRRWFGPRGDSGPGSSDPTASPTWAWAEPLVDRAWYLSTYPDVAAAGMDPVQHYARWGLEQGRHPRAPEG